MWELSKIIPNKNTFTTNTFHVDFVGCFPDAFINIFIFPLFFVEKFRAKLLTKHFKHIFPIAKHFSLYFINNRIKLSTYCIVTTTTFATYINIFFLKQSVDHIRFLFNVNI